MYSVREKLEAGCVRCVGGGRGGWWLEGMREWQGDTYTVCEPNVALGVFGVEIRHGLAALDAGRHGWGV